MKNKSEVNQMSPLVWAYIGDSVYELYIREHLVQTTNFKPHKLHIETIKYVETVKYIDYDENDSAKSDVNSVIPAISVEGQKVVCNDLYPTDQPQEGAKKECVTELVVKNLSTLSIKYNLNLNVLDNTYTSDNFKYKVTSTNGGGNMNVYEVVPKTNSKIFDSVLISSLSTQTYKISFILEGTNEEQNYDANRSFSGELKVELNND